MEDLTSLFSGIVIGVILFQTGIIAPIVFRTLNENDAGIFLRTIFPKFFIFLSGLNLINFTFAVIDRQVAIAIIAGVSSVLMIIAYLFIPATNRSRDEGLEQRFKRLHSLSVLLTVAVLGMNIATAFL